jgi:hypothetical protein
MESKILKFENGAELKVDDNTIAYNIGSNKSSIEADMFDAISYNLYFENRISPGGLYFRILFFSFISIFLIFFLSLSAIIIYTVIIGILNAILTIVFGLDALLELNFFRNITNQYFSDNYYHVEIASKTGNNIKFFTSIDELNKIKEVEKCLTDLKKHINGKIVKETIKPEALNYHDDLKKLNDLLLSGIINQDEFDLKKKQILGI